MLRMPFCALALAGLLALVASPTPLHAQGIPRLDIPPTAADLPGPFEAAALETSFRNANGLYAATVRYPASAAGAPYPAVIYAPGLNSRKEFNAEVGAHLATHGYVVLTFTEEVTGGPIQQKIDGLVSGLEFLVAANEDHTSPLLGLVDPSRRVVMGHSQGGEAALQVAASDPTLAAVVAEAPSVGFFVRRPIDTITAPTLLQAATLDKIVPFQVAVNAYETQLRAAKQLVVIQGGNHVGFNDTDSPARLLVEVGIDNPPTLAYEDQRLLARRYETAWLEFHTKGRSEFLTLIDGERVRQDVDTGLLSDARSEL